MEKKLLNEIQRINDLIGFLMEKKPTALVKNIDKDKIVTPSPTKEPPAPTPSPAKEPTSDAVKTDAPTKKPVSTPKPTQKPPFCEKPRFLPDRPKPSRSGSYAVPLAVI